MTASSCGASVTVWWTPQCGYLHMEHNPTVIAWDCPDGH